jgi:hypothetical protein
LRQTQEGITPVSGGSKDGRPWTSVLETVESIPEIALRNLGGVVSNDDDTLVAHSEGFLDSQSQRLAETGPMLRDVLCS